jgi:crossover junction endodeoxyribonuclease RuvC
MKVILGIDPGLASTGYGVIRCSGSRFRCIVHGTVRTSPKDGMGERLVQIHQGIMDIITAYEPEEAGIETVYFSKNSKSAIPVAQARGVVLYTLASRGVPFAEYTPLELKQAVVGNGRAEKSQVQQVLKMIFKLEELPRPDHASDALAAAFCHANFSSFRKFIDDSRSPRV